MITIITNLFTGNRKWITITITVLLGLVIAYFYFVRDLLILENVNKHLDLNGVHLLQSEKQLLTLLGKGKREPGVNAGYRYVYEKEGLKVGFFRSGGKVVGIWTTNPEHQILGLRVGSPTTLINATLGRYHFKKTDEIWFRRGEIQLQIQGNDVIESITIIFEDKHRDKNVDY